MKKSFKGIYKPINPKKYVGNPNNIIYRSLLERRFMVYCDNNPGIVQWASEELPIRYYNPLIRSGIDTLLTSLLKLIKVREC